jgi:hypothetical protein
MGLIRCAEASVINGATSQESKQVLTYSLLTYLLTHSLTPWCRVLLEQLTGLQLVKKFPAFHGTRRFITALTSVRHLSLSWASPIQSIYPHPTSWRSILISAHLRLGLPSGADKYTASKALFLLRTLSFFFATYRWMQINFVVLPWVERGVTQSLLQVKVHT